MLNRTNQKRYTLLTHYFVLYTLLITYFALAGCNGVRPELVPKRNITLAALPKKSKEQYQEILQMNNEEGKERIEKEINKITTVDDLKTFLKKIHQNYTSYTRLLKLLPKSERPTWQQNFEAMADPDGGAKLIDQNSLLLQRFEHAPEYEQHYMDLLEIIEEKEAVALKNQIVHATTSAQINELIASKLPEAFKQLSDKEKKNLSKLADHRRQEVLKAAMDKDRASPAMDKDRAKDNLGIDPETVPPESQAVTLPKDQDPTQTQSAQWQSPNRPNDGHTDKDALSLDKLIEQKIQAQSNEDEQVPQDDWGEKLSLTGKQRKQFLLSIMEFSQSDQKYLKEVFNKTKPDSIANFLDAYHEEFNEEERMELLATLIYLYKGWPALTITLCNEPNSLGSGDKFNIYLKTKRNQLKLLTRLEAYLE